MRYNNSFTKNVLLHMSDNKDNKNTSSNHKLIAATTSDTIITANKNTQTDMKSEYAFKEKLKNFKASFNRDTVNDDDVDNDHLTTIKGNYVIGATDAVVASTATAAAVEGAQANMMAVDMQPPAPAPPPPPPIITDQSVQPNCIDGDGGNNEQINMIQQINDDNNDSITLKLLWPPKQLQFNQSDVLPDNKKLSKMVHNNKMYQIIRDNNSFKSKNILNATDTFCDNYKNELNVAKSDKLAERCVFNTRTATTTSSMANDTTAKTTNSTTYDNRKNRYEHEIHENNVVVVAANEPTVNANNMLPSLSSMSNDKHSTEIVLATKTSTTTTRNTTSHISFDKLIELLDSESKRIRDFNMRIATTKNTNANGTNTRMDAMRLLRLCGGGEQGINNGTTGWGSPPTAPSAAAGGSNASTSSWGSTQPPQQQWDQPSGSNAAVNVNVTNANVGQNTTMWPSATGANPGSQQTHEQIQSASKAQGQPQQPQQAPAQQPQPQQPAGGNNNNNVVGASGSNNPGNNNSASGLIGGGTSTAAAKNQLEQLTTMRDALFSQDGWGCQHVNQDTNWDVPGSPEPMAGGNIVKSDPTQAVAAAGGAAVVPTTWKPNINNGTELWEANLRNGGQPPAPAVQKPWGHTPSTNLGGTWGEDDDGADSGCSSSVWATQSAAPAQQWNQPSGSNAAVNVNAATASVGQNSAMWPPTAGANPATTTAAPLQPPQIVNPVLGGQDVRNVAANQMDIRNADPRDIRLSNGPHFNIPMAHQRDPTRDLLREISRDVRGDLRGISGRLNGTSEMWGQHHNLTQGVNQQTAQQPQAQQSQQPQSQHGQMPMKTDKPPSGWEEPSPPTQRRNIPNYDDGTSLWAPSQQPAPQQPNQQQTAQPQPQQPVPLQQNRGWPKGGRSSWDEPVAGSGSTTPQLPQSRIIPGGLPSGLPSGVKQDCSMWNQAPNNAGRTSSWDEHSVVSGVNEKNAAMNANTGGAWDAQSPGVWQQQQQQQQAQQQQQKNKQLMGLDRNSTSKVSTGVPSYRILFEMGYKKEDIELALRATNLNLEEAIEILNQSSRPANIDGWRRHDEHNAAAGNFEHNNFPQRYPGGPQQAMPFQNNNPNLLNTIGVSGVSTNPGLNATGNMQPMQAQKYLNQGAHNASGSGSGFNQGINQTLNAGNSGNSTPAAGQPSTQQLRMLVQQIQMAVQAGYLNHQILNQPLAPTTLVLLNQLLAHIKQLQVNQANMIRGINNIPLSLNISKLKQQIATLQSQIAQQQAAYVNKQPGGNHNMSGNGNVGIGAGIGIANIGNVANAGVGPSPNDYLRSQHDPINTLQGSFSEMSMTKEPPNSFQNSSGSQQSRLNQWKLPNFDKDGGDNTTDFSRAPGTTSKSTMSTSNSVIGSLGLQDGTWSSGRSISDGWPDSTPDSENKDWPSSQQSPAAAFTDLVPEFEPGKPWKGTQMKTIEDDPSITPGSVARSPLSISAAKDTDLFATSSKTSPTDIPPLSLSSSTWSFNPTGSSSQPHFTSSKGSNWSDGVAHQMGNQSELWSAPMANKTARGPPPGLGNNNKGNLGGTNAITSTATSSSTNGWIGGNLRLNSGSWPSTWLLLKNMTAQIDGSTLRTLCMQHGPLQHFHLYLNHGIALCKYSTREEANKAQMALNNCVLGNTTICAESPCESEVQNILQHLGVPNQQQPPPQQQPQSQNPQQPQQPQPGQQTSAASLSSQWRPSSQNTQNRSSGSDTWGAGSVVWPSTNPAGNFWTGLDAASTERGTPSSLNSLLPENLLGNELN